MSLTGLLDVVVADPALAEAARSALAGDRRHLDLVGPPAARPFAVAALARALAEEAKGSRGRPVLAVTATGREAEDLAAALGSLLPPDSVAEFPAWETLPHERLSPRSDTVGRRLAVLRRIVHPSADDPSAGPLQVIVAPFEWPWPVKFAVILGVAFPLMLGSYQLLVRHSFIGAMLNGPRESRPRAPKTATAAIAIAPQSAQP